MASEEGVYSAHIPGAEYSLALGQGGRMHKPVLVPLLIFLLTPFLCSQQESVHDPAEASAYQTALYTDPPLARAAAL